MEPAITIEEAALESAGFTRNAIERYAAAVQQFAKTLFKNAQTLGTLNKADGLTLEVSYEHVRAATDTMSRTGRRATMMEITGQVFEYVGTLIAGIGSGHLGVWWGIVLFIAGAVLALALFVTRKTRVA